MIDDMDRAKRIWQRRVLVFSSIIAVIAVMALIVFGHDGQSGKPGVMPLPFSLAGLVIVYAIYAWFDLGWVRDNLDDLTDWGFKKRAEK